MANQMIALQTRNPQLPDPSRAAAQYANMMNMAAQQRATQLQAERTRQEMDFARASEGRAAQTQTSNMRKADLEYQIEDMKRLRNIGATVLRSGNEDAYQDLLGMISESDPQFGNLIRRVAPTFNPDVLQTVIMEADKFIDKSVATPVASLELGMDNMPRSVTVGGLSPQQSPVYDAPEPQALRTPVATPAAAAAGTPMRATRGANTTPQDLMQQGMDPRNIPSGMPTVRPISFNQSDMGGAGQMSPDMVPAILDSAINTGVMAQIDLDQMLAMTPPEARQGIMDVIRSSNIALQADAPSLAASAMDQQQPMAPNPVGRQQSQFAVMRGKAPPASLADLGGQPEMQNVMAQTQPRTITRLQQRNPNVSPTPSPVDPAILGAQEAAKTQAAENVRLKMAPQIAAETMKAERAVEKRSEALAAKNETKAAIQSLDKYIEEIDALLRSADRRFIVGRIEGNLHYLGSLGQNERQAELQAMYDRVKNADTLGSLVEAKQATPTGGSPVGNASNLDVQLIAKSANSLTQTGGVAKFDEDLKKLRREAYRTRQRRIEFYGDRYGDLSAEDPKFKLTVRPIADRYISSKDLPKPAAGLKTPTSTLSAATRKKYGL